MKKSILKQHITRSLAIFLTLLVLSVFFQGIISASQNNDYTSIIKESRTLISAVMTQEKIPGLAVAIMDNNKTVWTQGFGYTDFDKKRPVTPETIFSIQSISKTITATAEMMAVQDGLIDLDQPISTYIPRFTVNSRFEAKPQDKITIRHLLSHTAGFTHEAPVGNNCYPETPSFEAHIQSISDTWLRYPVGQRYGYSNLGIDLAGYILQIKSGKNFSDYVHEKLSSPFGMKSSSFDMEIIKKNRNRAIGHSITCKNVPLEIPMIPSGGFYSNVLDMVKFIQFHLNRGKINGKSLLSPELLDEMYTIPFPVKGQFEGYALGIDKVWNNKYHVFYYNHNGGGFGFLSSMTWYPDYGIGLIILSNSEDNTIQSQLTNQIMDLILKRKEPKISSTVHTGNTESNSDSINLSEVNKFAGRYLGRSQQLNVITNNPIGLSFNNSWYPAEFISPNELRLEDNNIYRFIPADQTPAYIIRTNDGITWDYNDGPNDPPGLDKPEWKNYAGTYVALLWGQTPIQVTIYLKNGYLYYRDYQGFDNKLMMEYKPGLFFTTTGECMDFSGNVPMFANFRVTKVN